MSSSFQKTFLLGNVTKDVELKYLTSGSAVANFSVAVNRSWKDDRNQRREETTFFDCAAFGRTAEISSEYLRKGSPVFLEGRFKNESWQDKQTQQRRSRLVLVVENLQLIGGKPEQNRPANQPVVPKQSAPPNRAQPKPEQSIPSESPSKPAGVTYNEFNEPSDVPF